MSLKIFLDNLSPEQVKLTKSEMNTIFQISLVNTLSYQENLLFLILNIDRNYIFHFELKLLFHTLNILSHYHYV